MLYRFLSVAARLVPGMDARRANRTSRALQQTVMAAALAVGFGAGCEGCAGCSDQTGSGPTQVQSSAPAWEQVGSVIPASAPAWIVARDYAALLAGYQGIRPRIEAIVGNVGMVETDLRNTMGVDLARVASLGEIGVKADGAAALFVGAAGPALILQLRDADTFSGHVQRVAQGQPFNFRAPPVQREHAGWQVTEYRREADGGPMLVVCIKDRFALLPLETGSTDAVLDGLDSAPGGAVERVRAVATRAGDAPIFGEADAPSLLGTQFATPAEGTGQPAIDAQLAALGSVGFWLTLTGEAVTIEGDWQPTGELGARALAALQPESAETGFLPVVTAESWAGIRLSVQPTAALALARELLGPSDREGLDQGFVLAREATGVDLEATLTRALRGNLMVLATRARLLGLRQLGRNSQLPDVASTFGLVFAFDLRDRGAIDRALTVIMPQLEGRAVKFENAGNTVVQFTDPQVDIGHIVVTDQLLLIVPERSRDDLAQRIASNAATGLRDETVATAMQTSAQHALFVDVAGIRDSPTGTAVLPMLPEQARRAAREFDRASVTAHVAEGRLRARATVHFSPPPAAE